MTTLVYKGSVSTPFDNDAPKSREKTPLEIKGLTTPPQEVKQLCSVELWIFQVNCESGFTVDSANQDGRLSSLNS